MSTKTLKLWKTQKFTFLKIQKTQNTGYIQNNETGGTKNKHCNLLIYTVLLNRVLIKPCYYNIQTIKYHNNAELIFLQHISRRCQRRLWNFEKHKNFHFSKSNGRLIYHNVVQVLIFARCSDYETRYPKKRNSTEHRTLNFKLVRYTCL